jgi:hypothetical protein
VATIVKWEVVRRHEGFAAPLDRVWEDGAAVFMLAIRISSVYFASSSVV